VSEIQNTVTLLTPPGVGAIAVVRVCGPRSLPTLENHFSKVLPAKNRTAHGDLTVDGRVLDDIVIARISDDAFDLNVHGGDWIVRSAIKLFVRQGFVVTTESPDASDSMLRREILAHLPQASTEVGVRLLLAQESLWNNIKARVDTENVSSVLRDALHGSAALCRLLNPPRVAIVGSANVGKSTLANQLFGSDRSITADLPGTTRDWVGELANINGLPVMLVDTPGIRQTSDEIEHAAIRASGKQIEQADLIVLVIDATRPLAEQRESIASVADFLPPQVLGGRVGVGVVCQPMSNNLDQPGEPPPYPSPRVPGEGKEEGAIIVVNKSDRPEANGITRVKGIRTVATTGHGVDQLREALVKHFCGSETIPVGAPRLWTERQRRIVERALDDVDALREL
jgi:tRNA U34 5-carboxymethylaminomethyl modifying GTPase MnmE/TrmE